jgi:hypothetical protein
MLEPRRKKKVDYEALNSPLMQIPRMSVESDAQSIGFGDSGYFSITGAGPGSAF